MTHPILHPAILPSHRALEHETRAGVTITHHTFEAYARYSTQAADGVISMRVERGQVQVVGASGREAWAIGTGELVVLSGGGPYTIVAVSPSDVWICVHHTSPRAPRLSLI